MKRDSDWTEASYNILSRSSDKDDDIVSVPSTFGFNFPQGHKVRLRIKRGRSYRTIFAVLILVFYRIGQDENIIV